MPTGRERCVVTALHLLGGAPDLKEPILARGVGRDLARSAPVTLPVPSHSLAVRSADSSGTSTMADSLDDPAGTLGSNDDTYPRAVDPRRLAHDLAVEYLGEDDAPDPSHGHLRHGHPGRITDPSPQDVFVEWFGLEDKGASRWICYDYEGLAELEEAEYERRCQRLQQGLPPIE